MSCTHAKMQSSQQAAAFKNAATDDRAGSQNAEPSNRRPAHYPGFGCFTPRSYLIKTVPNGSF